MTVTGEAVLKLLAFVGVGMAQALAFHDGPDDMLTVLACAGSEELLRILPLSGSWYLRRGSAIWIGLTWGVLEGRVAGNWLIILINGSCHAGYGLTYSLLSGVHPIVGLTTAVGLHFCFNYYPPCRMWVNLAMIILLIVSRKWKEGAAQAAPSVDDQSDRLTVGPPAPRTHPSAASCSEV